MKKVITIVIAIIITLALVITLSGWAVVLDYDRVDWMAIMIESAQSGDDARGQWAETERNNKIERLGLDVPCVAYEDLYLLGKIMTLEAGDCPYDECPLGVGEVVLNRVASPEWDMPDTIREVLMAPRQYYYPSMAARFEAALPSERCLRLALRLLNGERHMEPYVIYHDNWGGHGAGPYVSYWHPGHGRLYFCISGNWRMYEYYMA